MRLRGRRSRLKVISTAKIADGAVTNARLADGSVSLEKLAAGFIAPMAEKLSHAANISSGGVVLAGGVGISQANVTHPSVGFYCFSGLTPAPAGGVATVDYAQAQAGKNILIQLGTGQARCAQKGPRHSSIQEKALTNSKRSTLALRGSY